MPSELDGQRVVEVHETFDADGNPSGTVRVTRAPRVSKADRDDLYALHVHDARLCPCGCGQLSADTRDEKAGWQIETWKCTARAALDMAMRDARQSALPEDQRIKGWRRGRSEPMDGMQFRIAGKAPPLDQGGATA